MFLTNILLKKAKSKLVLVLMESVASGHTRHIVRDRLEDKLETIKFDPYIQAMALYREKKKIRGVKGSGDCRNRTLIQ